MPPLPLALTFRALLPGLSTATDAVLGALVASDGVAITAGEMARRVGFRTRFQLNRRLQHDGLPTFGELSDWVSVLAVLWHAEAKGDSLLSVATRVGLEPATCYRRCRRTLGVPWRDARRRGFAWGLERFLHRCGEQPRRAHRPAPFTSAFPAPAHTAALSAARPSGDHAIKGPPTHPQGVVAFQIAVPDAPTDIAVSPGGVIYVTRAYAASVARIDLDERRMLRSIAVGSNPTRLVFGPGRSAFVTNQFGGSISVLDVLADTLIWDIPIPGDPAPLGVTPDGRVLYVATNHDRLYAVSLTTRKVLRELALPATSHHLAFHPRAPFLFVSTRTAGTVMEVELPSLRPRRTFATGGRTQALAVAPDATELYVADEEGAVHVINLEGGSPAATVHLPGGAYGLDLTPDGTQLYVAIPVQGRVYVLDRVSRRLVHTIPTEGSPRHTAFAANGRTGLIVNESGWITVVW
jgi:DNA-binding beta-propeller fold protein YncE